MFIFFSIFIPLLVGGTLTYLARKLNWGDRYSIYRINTSEFTVSALVIILVGIMVTAVWGPSIARASESHGFHQFYNGSLVSAQVSHDACSRDGSCEHDYDCDPYIVAVQHTYTDSKGNIHSYTTYETRYHSCPYVTDEDTYTVTDSLGRTTTIANHIFQANPVAWRSGHGIPGGVEEGVPAEWANDRQRLAAGDAPPVTMENDYTNYILPSDSTLKSFSANIRRYQTLGLIPPYVQTKNPLYDYNTQARKVVVAGLTVPNLAVWQDRLMRFNAALGMERQGDLHLLIVPASKIGNPDDYTAAVRASWLNGLGKWGFPKNGIMVVLGVTDDGKTIQWARAKTGMPIGNGEMLTAISFQLQGKPFDPDVVLGKITGQVHGSTVTYTHGKGLLDSIVFTQYPFLRACMNCKDKGDHGTSYVYLKSDIPVSGGAKVAMFFIVLAISLALWAVALFFNPLGYFSGRNNMEVA